MRGRPYHLCFVDSMRPYGGAEVWVLDTARALQERGLRVSIVAQPDAEWIERARAAHIPVAAIPIRFDAAPWTIAKLLAHFASTGATAVVANLTKDLKAAATAGRLARVPIVLGSRESDFPLKTKPYYRWYFTGLGSGLLVNSEATRRTVLRSAPWLDPARVRLLYKGIDTERFAPRTPPPAEPVVGFVGQLIERKGLPELMEAWPLVERAATEGRVPRPRLLLAGRGPLQEELGRWRAGLARPEAVELRGFVEDVAGFYQRLTMLVMPSRAEGFGLAAAEASACARPVIAARASSLPEIVRDGETGILVAPGRPDQLAAAIVRLCADRDLCQDLGAAGRRLIELEFSYETMLANLLAATGGPPLPPKGIQP